MCVVTLAHWATVRRDSWSCDRNQPFTVPWVFTTIISHPRGWRRMFFCGNMECLINISLIVWNMQSTLQFHVLLLQCSSRCSLTLPLAVAIGVLFFTQENKKTKQKPVGVSVLILEYYWLREKMVFLTNVAIQKIQSLHAFLISTSSQNSTPSLSRMLDSNWGKWDMEMKY